MAQQTIESRIIKTANILWCTLQFVQGDDFKEWNLAGDTRLHNSILKYQFVDPFKVWEYEGVLYCLDGRHRWLDLKSAADSGIDVPAELPATFIACRDMQEAAELVLVYSSSYARITEAGLIGFIEKFNIALPDMTDVLSIPDFDLDKFSKGLGMAAPVDVEYIAQSLQERFLIPPFSILDTRQGYWQERKRQWYSLGFNSQETREGIELVAKSGQSTAVYELRNSMRDQLKREPEWDEIIAEAKHRGLHVYEGASIFDPVLAEVCYRWFCPPGGTVLDPFAGGSVRGIVASVLKLLYTGIDLRPEQVSANWDQAKTVCPVDTLPNWLVGDSNNLLDHEHLLLPAYDFILSCPPYHDLEKYSDDPADLSNMDYAGFCTVYRSIITKAMARLKPNRFAVFVVGDIRDQHGHYRNFVSETIDCFTKCIDADGKQVNLYNEMILVNVAGSLPIRIGRQFGKYRKVGKMHQNVLVFYKGDPKRIKEEFPEIQIESLENF